VKKYILINVFERELGSSQVFDTAVAAMEAMVNTVAEIMEMEPEVILETIKEFEEYADADVCEVKKTSAWVNGRTGNTDLWIIELDTETWGCIV